MKSTYRMKVKIRLPSPQVKKIGGSNIGTIRVGTAVIATQQLILKKPIFLESIALF